MSRFSIYSLILFASAATVAAVGFAHPRTALADIPVEVDYPQTGITPGGKWTLLPPPEDSPPIPVLIATGAEVKVVEVD